MLGQFLEQLFPHSRALISGFGAGIMVAAYFSWFFGYLGGQPQLTTRFMAISNRKEAQKGKIIGIVWTILAYTGAILVGYLGIALLGPGALDDNEKIMPTVISELFNPLFASVLIIGILAAIISTANSLLILSATELSDNIIKPLRKGHLNPNHALKQSRWTTAFLAVVAFFIAYFSPSKIIYGIVSIVWAGIGGTFSVIILFALFWKNFKSKAALYSILFGLLFTIVWVILGFEKIVPSRLLTFPLTTLFAITINYLVKENVAESNPYS